MLYFPYPVLYWPADGHVALCGDAHHQVGLEGHQDILERIPEVGEEEDEQLVVEVEVKPLDVDDDGDDEEGVNTGQGDQCVVEGRFHFWPSIDENVQFMKNMFVQCFKENSFDGTYVLMRGNKKG